MILRCGTPDELETIYKARFIAFVTNAGEVNPATLPGLVESAALLVMLFAEETLIGTAAVKTPFAHHRSGEFTKAQVPDLAKRYPFELGWVVMHPDHRRRGHGRTVVTEAARRAPGGTYATTKTKSMHAILKETGFHVLGQPYRSVLNSDAELSLFGRLAG